MKQVFTAATLDEANREADKWWAEQHKKGMRVLQRSEVAVDWGTTRPHQPKGDHQDRQWNVTIHYEPETATAGRREHVDDPFIEHLKKEIERHQSLLEPLESGKMQIGNSTDYGRSWIDQTQAQIDHIKRIIGDYQAVVDRG